MLLSQKIDTKGGERPFAARWTKGGCADKPVIRSNAQMTGPDPKLPYRNLRGVIMRSGEERGDSFDVYSRSAWIRALDVATLSGKGDPHLERRLAAIMSADLAGYTRLVGADEEGTLRRFADMRDGVLVPLVTGHGGRVVKQLGDGLLVEFSSAVNAVGCAVAWQDQVAAHEIGRSAELRFSFRIGISLGDIVVEGDDIHGDGVNLAARLEAVAEPGGICVSQEIYRQSKGKVPVAFEDLGERELKNIAEPVRLFRVLGSAATFSEAPLPLPEKPSIAVLPFDNMSADAEQEYFSDGVTEDIITELSRFPTLFVIARNSTFSYKGKAQDLKKVARELGVQYILEGSIRRIGQRVRITAQLIDAATGSHTWAERYDRQLEDIFDLQEEITRNVVGAIAPQIEMAELARVLSSKAMRFSAYDLALKAQSLFYEAVRMGDQDVYQKAIEAAESALALDPRCTHALWVLAWAHGEAYLYRWGPDPDGELARGWAAVERFFKIDSTDPRAYMCRGLILHFRGEFDAALADYHRAFEINPNFALNIFTLAWCESLSGLTDDAREHAALGLRLSPRDDAVWLGVAYLAMAQASFADGDFEQTRTWATKAIQAHPRAPIRRALMIACCVHDGDMDAAVRHVDFLDSFAPDFIPSVLRGDITLFKLPEHNMLLAEGLRDATLPSN
jgi:adenylate cyclase